MKKALDDENKEQSNQKQNFDKIQLPQNVNYNDIFLFFLISQTKDKDNYNVEERSYNSIVRQDQD